MKKHKTISFKTSKYNRADNTKLDDCLTSDFDDITTPCLCFNVKQMKKAAGSVS